MPDDVVLSLKEVAKCLKVSEFTTHRVGGGRKLPAFRVGGSRRSRRPEFNEWIKFQSHGVRRDEDVGVE